MKREIVTNDFVIKFATVNGTGSASANKLFSKAVFRMGVPVSPKNIFPSNIQGLPTWYEVRISEKGYLARRGGVDIMVGLNPQSMAEDIKEVERGGYFLYDSTKPLNNDYLRDDIDFIGLPLIEMCRREYEDLREQQLFRNIMYIGAIAALLDMELDVLEVMIAEQFRGKDKFVKPNVHALHLGHDYARENFECPIAYRIERRDNVGDQIMIDGNTACSLGAIYGGATVAAWYPITPSTSVIDGYLKYCKQLRIDPETKEKRFAIIQAEDELAAIGMVIGAGWNGARAFTATSGPGISLMYEFLGLAYFAEVPAVLIDVQRAGPSTGMPTRTQQSDLLTCAYASHGDTKQICLYPSTPQECFHMTAQAFDLAERLQTPVLILSDLDLGMNDTMSEPLTWDETHEYDRGKVYNKAELEVMSEPFGRYLDSDDDGITYRTYPGVHPTKGAFFTRGSSKGEYAVYTESGQAYVDNMNRLQKKWETAKRYLPKSVLVQTDKPCTVGVIYFGTSRAATLEALDTLDQRHGISLDSLGVKAFPFTDDVVEFIDKHEFVFVVEQNRDAQIRTLLINEGGVNSDKLVSVLHYNGSPITARHIHHSIRDWLLQKTTSSRV